MFHVQCDDIEGEMSGCGSDDEVFDSDGDSLCGLLAFDAAGKLRDGKRNGMDDYPLKNVTREGATAFALGIGSCAVDAVGQFDGADRGQREIELTMGCSCLTEDVSDVFASPFTGDEDGGVEDQSHAEVSRGLRFAMISSMSAAKSGSITTS